MPPGRNDACHCGSGKKYKKCCLAKDEETARKKAEAPAPTLPAAPPERPLATTPARTPEMEAWDARWEAFDEADYSERIAIFERTLDDPALMDKEMAFEMMNQLFEQTIEHNERDRFDSFVAMLRERAPKVYEEEAHNLLDWLILNAAAKGDAPRIAALTREFTPHIENHFDAWSLVEGCVAYHGQLGALAETMREAWPLVQRSHEIMAWAIDEFYVHATQYELLDYVATHAAPTADALALRERLRPYGDGIDTDLLPDALACLTGQFSRQWTHDDFWLSSHRNQEEATEEGDAADSGRNNLYKLTLQFVAYAHRVEGAPYGRAELARRGIHQFLTNRQRRDFEREEIKLSSSGKPRARRARSLEPGFSLCPDAARLDRFLAQQLDLFSPQRHFAVAMVELLPAWLRFLESQRLLDEAARRKILSELIPVSNNLREAFRGFSSDPTLSRALENWGQKGD